MCLCAWRYSPRGELVAAAIGTNLFDYSYNAIGSRQRSSFNAETNTYAANALNQYVSVTSGESTVEPLCGTVLLYDVDGNLTNDTRFAYAYDAENRMISARPIAPVEGDLAVVNAYDHRHRRIMKRVERFDSDAWKTAETHAFVYDGCNIVLERIAFADGSTRTVEYFWGNDLSGMEQSAGNAPVAKRSGCLSEANPQGRKGPRVGGLLAVSIDGSFYIPCYDHNGNIVCYVSESGAIAAQYVYDPYGNIIEQSGVRADALSFRFSTKYHDAEIGLISYLYRFYHPVRGCWLNRDPIEEEGGENLYAFCEDNPLFMYDSYGLATRVIKHLPGIEPELGWTWGDSRAETHWKYPSYQVTRVSRGAGKVGYRVTISPPTILIHVYFRNSLESFLSMADEQQHINAVVRYDNALTRYKNNLECVCECPAIAAEIFKREDAILRRTFQEVEDYHDWLDSPNGPHGHH